MFVIVCIPPSYIEGVIIVCRVTAGDWPGGGWFSCGSGPEQKNIGYVK